MTDTPNPATPAPDVEGVEVRDLIIGAWIDGAMAIHVELGGKDQPDFTEAAHDYAASVPYDLDALLRTQADEIARLRGERDEALDRAEELEANAEIVSVEFEKDLWVAVRWLLEKIGHTDFSEGVTAEDAREILWDEIKRLQSAEADAQALRAKVEGARAALEAIAGREGFADVIAARTLVDLGEGDAT